MAMTLAGITPKSKRDKKIDIASGTNTTIKGAIVSAKDVDVEVGTRDSTYGASHLTIESLQDTSTYKSKQQNVGGSVSVGAGRISGIINISQSKINNDYASVNQQSGIHAGDGGFHVSVLGDTTLTGGVITSTDKAVNDGKNSFSTGGQLTASDIQNKANYQNSYANYDPKGDINGTVAGERSQVNNQAFKYQQRVDNPFA